MTKTINIGLLLAALALFCLPLQVEAAQKPELEKINVFCVVSENIETELKTAAKALKASEGLSSFCLEGCQIHCTLYMTMYPKGLKDTILSKIEKFAKGTRRFSINTAGLEITSGDWFFMNLEKNRNLQTLSDAVVQMLSPLRSPSKHIPNWAKPFKNKVEYISKYGSPNVYDEFNPHLTLLAPSDVNKLKRFAEANKDKSFAKPIKGKIVGIGVGIADRNGQVPNPWRVFQLQK